MFSRVNILSALCALTALALLPAPSLAQQGDEDALSKMTRELNALLDKGEQERLIDPWFLRDLRAVIDKYDWPWSRLVLEDDFSGRGPEPGPPWDVTAGEFLIDWRSGLRSMINGGTAPGGTQSSQPQQEQSEEDMAKALLGAFLKGALDGGSSSSSGSGQTATAPAEARFAAVQARRGFANAFALEAAFTFGPPQRGTADGFEIGPYQGENAASGYRLSYIAPERGDSGGGSLQLLKVSPRGGVAMIEAAAEPVRIDPAVENRLVWLRDANGGMEVRLNDRTVITVRDNSFRDPFSGLAIVNRGGDLSVKSVRLTDRP